MTPQDFLNKVVHVQQWQQHGKRAAHKPLLLLYALGEVMSKDSSQFHAYSDVDPKLQNLLRNWGDPISSGLPRTHEPFARLKRDGIWELKDSTGTVISPPTHPSRKGLLDAAIVGGFPNEIHEMLRRNQRLALEAARRILVKNWPASLHLQIARAVGISLEDDVADSDAQTEPKEDQLPVKRVRDPRFRNDIIRIYERACAVCEFDLRLQDSLLDLEAAHIQWHAHGGPDLTQNGLALCGLHHKAFDRGALGLKRGRPRQEGYEIMVSQELSGSSAARHWLLDYQGKPLKQPISPEHSPGMEYIEWHTDQVFRRPART